MKKSKLVFIILIIIAVFVGADYYLNNLGSQVSVKDLKTPVVPTATTTSQPTVNTLFKINDSVGSYKITSQVQTSQIFEKIDLSNITNIEIYLNKLEKASAQPSAESDDENSAPESVTETEPIYLYEIHGPNGQGSLTYLNVKLQFVSQLSTVSEEINEDASFGNNSFFFNDKNYPNTAFLLIQINDNLFAFQYSKSDSGAYDNVKSLIQNLLSGTSTQPVSTTTNEAVTTESSVTTTESITEESAQPSETTSNL